jgi:hypothetical protein
LYIEKLSHYSKYLFIKGTGIFALDGPKKNCKEILVPKIVCLIFKPRESTVKYRMPLLSTPRLRKISQDLPEDVASQGD